MQKNTGKSLKVKGHDSKRDKVFWKQTLLANTHIKYLSNTHKHTRAQSFSMQGDSAERPKSCVAFHISCQVKTLVAAEGYCIGLLVTFHGVHVTFQLHATTPTDICSSPGTLGNILLCVRSPFMLNTSILTTPSPHLTHL